MRRDPALLLLFALLFIQAFIIVRYGDIEPYADELYYLGKAKYIAEHHRFAPIDPAALAVERGERWGNGDFRPPGYPLLLAAISLGDFHDEASALRRRAEIVQFAAMAIVLTAFYLAIARKLTPSRRYIAAVLFGAPPWFLGLAQEYGPDAFVIAFIGAGVLLLSGRKILLGSIAVSATVLLRPEMIAMAPIPVGIALITDRAHPKKYLVAALPFLIAVAFSVGYRSWLVGTPSIAVHHTIYNRGILDWINTWFGTEKEGDDFAFAVSDAKYAMPPEHAFASRDERAAVDTRVREIAARGAYTRADDDFFESLAARRRESQPATMVMLRFWHATHLWFNTETNSPLLVFFATIPRSMRRAFLGSFVLLRLIALALALVAAARAFPWWRPAQTSLQTLVVIALGHSICRTLLMGVILNWKQHRYVADAWPLVLACAAIALMPARTVPTPHE